MFSLLSADISSSFLEETAKICNTNPCYLCNLQPVLLTMVWEIR
jgi:hypothetical protein